MNPFRGCFRICRLVFVKCDVNVVVWNAKKGERETLGLSVAVHVTPTSNHAIHALLTGVLSSATGQENNWMISPRVAYLNGYNPNPHTSQNNLLGDCPGKSLFFF
jgi:hypothetical protein